MTADKTLEGLRLYSGGHSPNGEMCFNEAVAWWAGEPWSAAPQCASPLLTRYSMSINDNMPDELRQRMVPLVPRMVGTRGDGHDLARVDILVTAACDMAELVLPIFETRFPNDDRPRKAIEIARTRPAYAAYAATAAYAAADAAYAAADAARNESQAPVWERAIRALEDCLAVS